jgi:hypothetical protein
MLLLLLLLAQPHQHLQQLPLLPLLLLLWLLRCCVLQDALLQAAVAAACAAAAATAAAAASVYCTLCVLVCQLLCLFVAQTQMTAAPKPAPCNAHAPSSPALQNGLAVHFEIESHILLALGNASSKQHCSTHAPDDPHHRRDAQLCYCYGCFKLGGEPSSGYFKLCKSK